MNMVREISFKMKEEFEQETTEKAIFVLFNELGYPRPRSEIHDNTQSLGDLSEFILLEYLQDNLPIGA